MQRRGGESGPRLFKCRKTSCVCKVIWAPELENPSEPFCCWFEETHVMKVFLGHYSGLFFKGCWHVGKLCIYFDFNVLLFCILTQNNTFPCEPELQLEPGYRFKINLVSQRSTSLIAVRNHFPYLYLQFLRESWAYLGKILSPCFYPCFGIR